MKFTKKQLNNFKETWLKETGNNISNKESEELLESLIRLLAPVYRKLFF